MKTWVKTFRFEYFTNIDCLVNEYCKKRNLTPLSISIITNCGMMYVAVVVTKNEESEGNDGRKDLE
jgi:hypothetical protein